MDEQSAEKKTVRKKQNGKLYALLALVVFAGAIFLVATITADKKSQAPAHAPQIATVRITKTGFEPTTLTVKQGTKVIWTNADNTLHQIVSNPYPKGTSLPSLKSEILNSRQAYGYVAKTQGTYGYHDQMQPTINGTLIVQKP